MTRTTKILAGAALTAALTLGACSSGSTGTSGGSMSGHDMSSGSMPGSTSMTGMPTAPAPSGGTAAAHNQADITFASSMVPHHQQAVEMADLALAQASNPTVKQLATQIKAAQDPEIQTMTGWLTAWGATPMPSGHNMGGMGMDGMMTDQDMADLKKATGAAFDRMWLQMMVKHHQGAVAMAKTQLAQGAYPDAKTLAQAVIDGQTKEIATMTDLLKTL